jgi:branched-chain amino acid transport system substrate-binding protein
MYSVTTTIESGLYASEFAVKQAGFTKQALIQCNSVAACTSALPLAKAGAKSLGIDLFTTQVSPTAPDYTPQCLAAKNFGAQAAELGGINPQTFAKSCTSQNYKPTYVNEYDLFRLSQIAATPEFEGAIGNSQSFPTFESARQYSQLADYFSAMDQYAPQAMKGGSQYDNNYGIASGSAWAGAYVFGQGVANAKVPAGQAMTVADLRRGLALIPQGSTNNGYTPPVYYGNGTTVVQKAVTCFWDTKIVNGQYQLIGSLQSVTSQCEPTNLLKLTGGQTISSSSS